ncbi:MAG: ABC transporter permease [Victivallaceae bacterium]|jgi:putative ABC transport system permease protein
MISLARASLIYEWRRYLAAIFALGFSALLIYIQTGLMLGFSLSMTAILNNSQADLWVSAFNLTSFENSGGVELKNEYYLRMHPEIESVSPFLRYWCNGKTYDGEQIWAPLFGVNTDKQKCLLMPPEFLEEFADKLDEPMTVVIDRSFSKNLNLNIGDYTELSNKRVKIVGITDGYKNDRGGFVFASEYTFKQLATWTWVQFLMIRIRDPQMADAVAEELNNSTWKNSKLKAWSKNNLFWQSQKWQLLESPNSLTFIFLSILALFIGVAITNQSLRSAILASLKEYAALRALGVSKGALCMVVLEQAFWVGIAGLVLAWVLTIVFSYIAVYYKLAFNIPLWFVFVSTIALIMVSLVSGLLSLMVLYKTEPAELLR